MKPRHTAEQSTVRVNKAETMGKKGFAAVASMMSGVSEKKPFEAPLQKSLDIVEPAPMRTPDPAPVMTTKPATTKTESVAPARGAGYQSLMDLASNVSNSSSEKETAPVSAKTPRRVIMTGNKTCPTDPAELSQCDSCQ